VVNKFVSILKKILIPLIAIFLLPIPIRSHDQPAHEICKNAKDYVGCLKANKTFTSLEKAGASGAISAMECMKRRNLITQNEANLAIKKAFKELNIPIDAKDDPEVIKAAKEISYLYQVDCRTMVDTNQIKMQKLLGEL
tara:strand:+ start:65 stop:481 length:417 start_codon:yes stop_codon:yes gene_type:complete